MPRKQKQRRQAGGSCHGQPHQWVVGQAVEARYKALSAWAPATVQHASGGECVHVIFEGYSDTVTLPSNRVRDPVEQQQPDIRPAVDALKNFIDLSGDFGRAVAAQLETDGYVVLPTVLSGAEADTQLERMWSFVQRVAPGINRDDPRSWAATDGGVDPWPCKQRDMFQLHGAGWLFVELRELIIKRVFEPLFGTHKLHCSKDGFTFQRPTHAQVSRRDNDHFDQGAASSGLQCVQGSVALLDQDFTDGCFSCWPGSHAHRESLLATMPTRKTKNDFVMVNNQQMEALRQAGIERIRVPVKKGDVILWRSDLLHCGAAPIGACKNFRAVVYICALPAELTPASMYTLKRAAYEGLETGSHWPSKEVWFVQDARKPTRRLRPYFKTPPKLTMRQQELHGLVPYSADVEEPVAEPEPEPEPTAQ